MAAYDVEPGLHLRSRRRKARRDPREFASRRRRAQPLPALSPARCGRPRLLQRPHPARTQEPDRVRSRALGRTHARHAANLAVDKARQACARALPPDQLEALVERYWAAVRLGLAFHRDLPKLAAKADPRGRIKHCPGHNLLQRLKTFETETLRFLTDFDVPFTNNLAEQDLRMMKVKMKISGSFRTLAGAQIFARLRSVVSTARKHGRNILQILTASPAQIMKALAA